MHPVIKERVLSVGMATAWGLAMAEVLGYEIFGVGPIGALAKAIAGAP